MIRALSALLWAAGAILIALSWFNAVSRVVGWIGFGVALLGSALTTLLPKRVAAAKKAADVPPGGP